MALRSAPFISLIIVLSSDLFSVFCSVLALLSTGLSGLSEHPIAVKADTNAKASKSFFAIDSS